MTSVITIVLLNLFLLCICAHIGCSAIDVGRKSSDSAKVFDPTYDWKEVMEGQEVPGGLHIRMDLSQGKKWAKLLSEHNHKNHYTSRHNEKLGFQSMTLAEPRADRDGERAQSLVVASSKQSIISAAPKDLEETNRNQQLEKSPIESILNSFAALPEPPNLGGLTIKEARVKMSPEKFKSEVVRIWKDRQKMLLEASESIQDQIKSMKSLIDSVGGNDTSIRVAVKALTDLEWEVEDLDKAKDFHTLGGFSMIIRELNSSSIEIRSAAAWVLGSAVKNYAEAQKWACEGLAILRLLQNIRYRDDTSPHVENMHKKSIYALSSIVRSNPCGQRLFYENNGISAIFSLLDDYNSPQVRVKVTTLVRDLMDEDIGEHKKNDVPLVFIKRDLTSPKWCQKLPTLLAIPNNEIRQKTLEAMIRQLPGCATIFQTQQILDLVQLVDEAWSIKDSEIDVEYQQQLLGIIDELRNHLQNKL